MKKIIKRAGIGFMSIVIIVACVITILKVFPKEQSVKIEITEQSESEATPNSHLISEMQYYLDDLKTQFSGLDTWLGMAAGNPSLYIYGTWKNQLNHTVAKITVDFEEIEKLLPTGETEKKESMNEVRAMYFEAAGLIFSGISQSDQSVIDEGLVMINDLKVRIEAEWNWR